jgi:hypothetical protein
MIMEGCMKGLKTGLCGVLALLWLMPFASAQEARSLNYLYEQSKHESDLKKEFKGAPAGAFDSYSPAQLADKAEGLLREVQDGKDTLEPWLDSKAHFVLARAYFTFGDDKKAAAHLEKIKDTRDRRSLIRPFMDQIMTALRVSDTAKVAALIRDGEKHKTWIDGVHYVADMIDPELGTTVGAPIGSGWISKTLCSLSVKKLAAMQNLDAVDKVSALDACAEVRGEVESYRLAALVRGGRYADAWQLAAQTNALPLLVSRFRSCIAPSAGNAGKDSFAAFLLVQNDPAEAATAATLLHTLGRDDAAFAKLKGAGDTPQLHDAAAPLFRTFYLAGDKEKALAVADYMQMSAMKAELAGGWGHHDPHQWWVNPILPGDVLIVHPNPLGFELVMKIANAKARFTLLKGMFTHLGTEKAGDFPGCAGLPGQCIIDALVPAAEAEPDAWDRDTMYGFLSEMARLEGNEAQSKVFLGKIADMGRTQCAYDMCYGGRTVVPLSKAPPQNKKPLSMAELTGFDPDKPQPFEPVPTSHGELASAIKALHDHLNAENPDYYAVSTQSGYRISYLYVKQAYAPSHERTVSCDID